MKTIYTTLPVYDRLAKQAYERVKYANLDMMSPIKCPQWRLPSLLWNVESDDPGEITGIYLRDKTYTGDYASVSTGWVNAGYDTFTTVGMEVTSAIDAAGGVYARTAFFTTKVGTMIRFVGTLTRNSGAGTEPSIFLASGVPVPLVVGANDITLVATTAITTNVLALFADVATDFSIADVSVTMLTGSLDIMTYFDTTASYIQSAPGGGWSDVAATFDTFTSVDTAITRALKTTAVGEDYCFNIMALGSVPTTLAIGDVVRIVVDLTMAGGDEPKIELRNTGTLAVLSNTVQLEAGENIVILTATAALATGWGICIYNEDTELCDWSATFTAGSKTVLPIIHTVTDEYFQYNGETLGALLPEGIYYLAMETEEGFVYYSDWLEATCIYPNLLTDIDESGYTYDTFTIDGTEITLAINLAGSAHSYSNRFFINKDESIHIIFFLDYTSGERPYFVLSDYPVVSNKSSSIQSVIGLNDITLTSTETGEWLIHIWNAAASNFSTSDIWVIREYSEKYTRINFSNTCDLGDILYSEGLEQSLWLESEIMEPTFPLEEEGAKDGYARFIRSFARQDKKWLLRTKALPDFMADVLYRMMLHDTIELIDRVGDTHTVKALEVEHEYLWDDRYYVKFDLTFDFDEAVIIGGCCNNIT